MYALHCDTLQSMHLDWIEEQCPLCHSEAQPKPTTATLGANAKAQ